MLPSVDGVASSKCSPRDPRPTAPPMPSGSWRIRRRIALGCPRPARVLCGPAFPAAAARSDGSTRRRRPTPRPATRRTPSLSPSPCARPSLAAAPCAESRPGTRPDASPGGARAAGGRCSTVPPLGMDGYPANPGSRRGHDRFMRDLRHVRDVRRGRRGDRVPPHRGIHELSGNSQNWRNSSVNGDTFTFVASRNDDDSWTTSEVAPAVPMSSARCAFVRGVETGVLTGVGK